MPTKAEREQQEQQERADQLAAETVAEPVEGGKVRVPQQSGEITLTRGVEVVGTYTVRDGLVSPKDDDERAMLLGSVPGAVLDDA